jgi:hypothetical protein
MSHARNTGNRDQGDRNEEDRCGDKPQVPMTRRSSNTSFAATSCQRGVPDPGQFQPAPMRAAEGERQSEATQMVSVRINARWCAPAITRSAVSPNSPCYQQRRGRPDSPQTRRPGMKNLLHPLVSFPGRISRPHSRATAPAETRQTHQRRRAGKRTRQRQEEHNSARPKLRPPLKANTARPCNSSASRLSRAPGNGSRNSRPAPRHTRRCHCGARHSTHPASHSAALQVQQRHLVIPPVRQTRSNRTGKTAA